MRLGERLSTRDNNLNLIRFGAAVAVLVSHAWPIAYGPGTPEPLAQAVGISLGHIAVLVFFAASGFLITASFARQRTLGAFVAARVMRLFPGLAVSLLFVAFLLGPLFTVLPIGEYLANPETFGFVIRNLTLVRVEYDLPGVFVTNPYPAVEGSIWTLQYEVMCYVGVLIAGCLGFLARRVLGTVALAGWLAATVAAQMLSLSTFYQLDQLLALSQPFVLGMLAWLWRAHLPVGPLASLGLFAIVAAASATPAYPALLVLAISHATLTLALWPGGVIRRYNEVGDFSYGVYVYAFPVQGVVMVIFGPMTAWANIGLSLPLTAGLAIASWHWVEAPALRLVRTRSPRARVSLPDGIPGSPSAS